MTAPRKKVREPVQVYLTSGDRKLLRDVASAAGVSAAEVLRRGLRRMAGELLAERNPALRLLDEMNAAHWPPDTPADVGRNHDRYLVDAGSVRTKRIRRKK